MIFFRQICRNFNAKSFSIFYFGLSWFGLALISLLLFYSLQENFLSIYFLVSILHVSSYHMLIRIDEGKTLKHDEEV